MADLLALQKTCEALIENLGPAKRRILANEIAKRLRESQAKRIGQQLNPDGTPYAPRKKQLRKKKGSIRRKMFAKLSTTRWLKKEATSESATVTFADQAQRIAKVHQLGLRDKVDKRGGPEVKYEVRELLGITAADYEMIETAVLKHLAR